VLVVVVDSVVVVGSVAGVVLVVVVVDLVSSGPAAELVVVVVDLVASAPGVVLVVATVVDLVSSFCCAQSQQHHRGKEHDH